jgi:hypothetical protein
VFFLFAENLIFAILEIVLHSLLAESDTSWSGLLSPREGRATDTMLANSRAGWWHAATSRLPAR